VDGGDDKKELYLLVGEIKGKLDQLSQQLNGYFNELTKQINDSHRRMDRIEKDVKALRSDIDELRTRDKVYRAIITFIASAMVLVLATVLSTLKKL